MKTPSQGYSELCLLGKSRSYHLGNVTGRQAINTFGISVDLFCLISHHALRVPHRLLCPLPCFFGSVLAPLVTGHTLQHVSQLSPSGSTLPLIRWLLYPWSWPALSPTGLATPNGSQHISIPGLVQFSHPGPYFRQVLTAARPRFLVLIQSGM